MTRIHPTAIIHAGAELDEGVSVGPWAIVGPEARVGAGSSIGAHALIDGRTTLGPDNEIFPYAVVGSRPQDKKFKGENVSLTIGRGNTIREFVTINPGTGSGGGSTTIGDGNLLMAYVHIAHDCRIGSHLILANAVQLAGHVHLGDWVFLGGLSGVHQFVRVGAHAMTGFQTRLSQDLPPFVTAAGNPAQAQGVNSEGLRRRGFSDERMACIKAMHRALYRKGLTVASALDEIGALLDRHPGSREDIELMRGFVAAAERGIVR